MNAYLQIDHETDGEVISASWKKAILSWVMSTVACLIVVGFIALRAGGMHWYWWGVLVGVGDVVMIWLWGGFAPFRKRRLVIGANCVQLVEGGGNVIVHIPFENIDGIQVADHFDPDANARIPNHYLIITLRDSQDEKTRGTFETDKETSASYLQLQDVFKLPLPQVQEKLQNRFQAFMRR